MSLPYINVLIKPASGSCNMRCTYCFYADVMDNRAVANYGIMKTETAHQLIDRVLLESEHGCAFMFQGGEPTLAGLQYFEDFVSYVKNMNKKNIPVSYAIQTNGFAINDEWAQFFVKENFLVGLSLDGTAEVNAQFRFDSQKMPAFDKIMAAAKLFDRYKVEYNILTVVTPQLASKIHKVFPFYKQNGFTYQQYIPCIPDFDYDSSRSNKGSKENFFLTAKTYGVFLKKLFDLWYDSMIKNKYIYIRYFENLAGMLTGARPESCNMNGFCSIQFVVEADGSVYPCDFYVTDEWRIGSILDTSLTDLYASSRAQDFITRSRHIHPDCQKCEWGSLCRCGCYREREHLEKGGKNRFCSAFKEFFPYVMPRLQQLITKNRQR